MNLQTFFSNFELFADAPNGVQKLRELILQLAVQGKLVRKIPRMNPLRFCWRRLRQRRKG